MYFLFLREPTITNADTILVLDDGKLAGMGSLKQLLKECDVYRETICHSSQKRRWNRMSIKAKNEQRDKVH